MQLDYVKDTHILFCCELNSLRASKSLYIILSVLQPLHKIYVLSLQKVFIDFVCQSRHWLKSDRLYLLKWYGGFGLVHI